MMIFKNFVELQNENADAKKLGITQPTVTFHLKTYFIVILIKC